VIKKTPETERMIKGEKEELNGRYKEKHDQIVIQKQNEQITQLDYHERQKEWKNLKVELILCACKVEA
jgi:hypothetical protein